MPRRSTAVAMEWTIRHGSPPTLGLTWSSTDLNVDQTVHCNAPAVKKHARMLGNDQQLNSPIALQLLGEEKGRLFGKKLLLPPSEL